MMRAVVITGTGGLEVLEVRDVPVPEPRGEQVRVRVRAAGLNRAELLQARGLYPAPPGAPADILGLEFAGEVESLGPDVTAPWKPGDRVYGLLGGGGLAEQVVTHERLLVSIPSTLDFDEAAAVPEAFITAHDALDNQARLRPGEAVLIHAVGGGVGTAAVQIAHASGCPVIGTARTAWKLERARELGLDLAIDTSTEEFAPFVLAQTGDRGVPVIIDHLGARAWDQNLQCLASRGRLVVVGLLAGSKVPQADLGLILRKRATIVGTTLRARPLEEKIAATQAFAARVNPWLATRKVVPVLDRVYPLAEVREALHRLETNAGFGKIVLNLA